VTPHSHILKKHIDPYILDHGIDVRFPGFQNLMQFRIRDILLVSSLYDLFVFEEDGRLYELIRNEYKGLNLSHSPEITRVSSGRQAVEIAKKQKRFDLIITTQHIEDMTAVKLAKIIQEENIDIPVVLLAYDNLELTDLISYSDISVFDRVFIWTGDFRLMIAIIKSIEDERNVQQDTETVGVQSIILIEDNVRFYSSFLPMLYTEILKQSQRLISEGINLRHKYLRMRARPKILLCTDYDGAWAYFEKYKEYILGVISDIDFRRQGKDDPQAGIKFARDVKTLQDDIPILLQSDAAENEQAAYEVGASFLIKNSPTLLTDLRAFAIEKFGFGDFVFRNEQGQEVGRAANLHELEKELKRVPEESIRYHAVHNHFSNWLKARTEFALADKLRPRRVSDYASIEALRHDLVSSLREYRKIRQRGIITDFNKESFDPVSGFARIGGGSLGGKARGLSFVNTMINNFKIVHYFKDVKIRVPAGVVLGTEVFDAFLDENGLRHFSLNTNDDAKLIKIFQEAEYFPEDVLRNLADFLEIVTEPLAIRSSSLLEDSQYHPFAGVYETYMIPNNHPDPEIRLRQLIKAVKRVYASTFYQATKDYIKVTSYRLEEEKMAVIIHKLVGAKHGHRFYPTFSGVAKSYNFYPMPPQKPNDGIVALALGLGKWVVDGGNTVKFSPKYPKHILQFYSPKEALSNSQHRFFALDFSADPETSCEAHDVCVRSFSLKDAQKDGSLYAVGSTYSPENNTLYDGVSRKGIPVVTFAAVLKHDIFPLSRIIRLLLELGNWGMGTPVEIEFAVNLSVPKGEPKELGLLQMRPLALKREIAALEINKHPKSQLLCKSNLVLGHGIMKDIRDIVFVDPQRYDRAKSKEAAAEISYFNSKLLSENRPYLLLGVGRWGSLDSWLGIPVKWDQISGARAIVETSFKDFMVEPSQGSHFFQNLTSFMVGYFTVNPFKKMGFIDWDWLLAQKPQEALEFARRLRLSQSIIVKINGHKNEGVILKPGVE